MGDTMEQLHDEAHTADTCAECQRNRAAGTITIHYWESCDARLQLDGPWEALEWIWEVQLFGVISYRRYHFLCEQAHAGPSVFITHRALHLEEFTELFTQAVRFARGMSVTSPWHVQSTSHKSPCRARKAKRSEMSLRRLAISLGNYLHCHHA